VLKKDHAADHTGLKSRSKSLILKLANKLGFSRLPAEKPPVFSGGSIPLRFTKEGNKNTTAREDAKEEQHQK
jgi:hypothetical protein